MKKLSLIVLLILCVVIGGVYATWSYPGTQISDQRDPVMHSMASISYDGSSGLYEYENNSLGLLMDQAVGSYDVEMKYTGSTVIKFTAHENIDSTTLSRALNATITALGENLDNSKFFDTATSTEVNVFKVNSEFKIQLTEDSWTKEGNVYSYTLYAADLAAAAPPPFALGGTFNLPNETTYGQFQAAQSGAALRIVIKSGT